MSEKRINLPPGTVYKAKRALAEMAERRPPKKSRGFKSPEGSGNGKRKEDVTMQRAKRRLSELADRRQAARPPGNRKGEVTEKRPFLNVELPRLILKILEAYVPDFDHDKSVEQSHYEEYVRTALASIEEEFELKIKFLTDHGVEIDKNFAETDTGASSTAKKILEDCIGLETYIDLLKRELN